MGTIKPIDAQVDLLGDNQQFFETADQIEVQMLTPDGQNTMEQGQGLDRHIYLVREFDYKEIFVGNTSTAMLSGFVEGESYTIYVSPDQGDFDYLEYFDGPRVTFVYTGLEGSYIATDSQGNDIPFTVDSNGLMHLSLRIGKAQVYGNITMNNQPYQNDIYMTLYDKVTQNVISQGFAHTTGGYNGQPVEHGVFVLGSDETLSGEYTLVVSDPSDTVDYSGTSVDITLPLTGPLMIDLPKSKVYGSVVLSDADQLLYGDNIMRVFVNVFDASGEFVKNVLVRRDGKFSVGELMDGKYYAKVFVSPFSTLAEKYTSSKMNIFKVDNQMITPVEFDAPLVAVIGNGIVISPEQSPVSEVWVKIYNAQGKEVEAVKTNTQGEFKIPALADGQYELRALGAQGYKDSISQIITVSNQVVTGNTALTLTNTQIMGQAKLENDTNVGDVTVLLFDTDKNLISIQDCPEGAYSFGGMVAGTYYLQVRANLGSEIVDSEMMAINFEGTLIDQDLIVQSAYYHGIVLTPQDMPITKGWIHVYVDGEYFKSTIIDANGNFKLESFDPSKEVKIVAEDSTGNYMSSEAMVLTGQVNPVIQVRENVGLLGTLAYGSEILAQTNYYLYDEEGTPIYQSQTNAFGEFRLLDVTFGKYTIIVPIENGYLKGDVNFTTDGQTIPFVQLIKGE